MAFDPEEFAAKVVIGDLHPEDMPAAAQDALEAGFDGPSVVRLAILDNPSAWETDQLLPKVFTELGVERPSEVQAAILLAKIRGRRILDTGEDPLPSLEYFHRIFVGAGYPDELSELGWSDGLYIGYNVEGSAADDDQARVAAIEAIENLLDPELCAERRAWLDSQAKAAHARWEERRPIGPHKWPYFLNTPEGKREYWRRLRALWDERFLEVPWLLPVWILLVLGMSWLLESWWVTLFCLFLLAPVVILSNMLALWRRMERECQELRWRERIDP